MIHRIISFSLGPVRDLTGQQKSAPADFFVPAGREVYPPKP
jgi:hypothetical protein